MKICKVKGCNSKHHSKGYCDKHRSQIERRGKIYRTRFDPNEIVVKGNIAEVILYDRNGNEKARTIIDSKDIDKIKQYKWHFQGSYVLSNANNTQIANIIMGFNSNRRKMIDHWDRDPLNNRKDNLRICTASQNQHNRSKNKDNQNNYKDIYFDKERNKWVARLQINKRTIFLGRFNAEQEAGEIVAIAIKKYHKDFACL